MTINIIDDLTSYMVTNKKLAQCVKQNMKKIITRPEKKNEKLDKKHPSMFIPSQHDKLFWIFYVMKKGFDDYNLHQYTNEFSEENKIKFEYVDKIRANKALLKSHKIQKMSECESDLINERTISMKTFHVLCIIENIDFVFFTKNSYFSFMKNEEKYENLHVLHRINDYYAYEMNKSDLVPMYKEVRFKIEKYDKPLKAISSFKSDELIEIANFFKVDKMKDGKKKTKQYLYNELHDIISM